jgi:hypothetical protein
LKDSDIILTKGYQINYEEQRYFRYQDFQESMSLKTFQNRTSELKSNHLIICDKKKGFFKTSEFNDTELRIWEQNEMVLVSQSSQNLSNAKYTKTVTILSNLDEYKSILEACITENHNIHNLTVCFKSPESYSISSKSHTINVSNKEIEILKIKIDKIAIRVTSHPTDTIKITFKCTNYPIFINKQSLNRFNEILNEIQDKLQFLKYVPNCNYWYVTMFHYALDLKSPLPVNVPHLAWNRVNNELIRIYNKDNYKIRVEKQKNFNKFECVLGTLINKLFTLV